MLFRKNAGIGIIFYTEKGKEKKKEALHSSILWNSSFRERWWDDGNFLSVLVLEEDFFWLLESRNILAEEEGSCVATEELVIPLHPPSDFCLRCWSK